MMNEHQKTVILTAGPSLGGILAAGAAQVDIEAGVTSLAPLTGRRSTRAFRKSSHSAGMGQCVEVGGAQSRGHVAVRDSKDVDGTQLSVSSAGWREFIHQVKLGGVHVN
jgi:hypothetical protein